MNTTPVEGNSLLTATASHIWQGRSDSQEAGDTKRLFNIVRQGPVQPADRAVGGAPVLIGYACDAGVRRNQGRIGAAEGPTVLRQYLANLPAHQIRVIFDAGDVLCVDDALESCQESLAQVVHQQLDLMAFPIVLGGGHDVAWGSWQGLQRHLRAQGQAQDVLILNLDAHFDLRTTRPGNSGTPFDQIAQACQAAGQSFQYACLGVSPLSNTAALFQHASALDVTWIEDIHMQERHLATCLDQVTSLLNKVTHVYLTIDLDVLPAAVMPAVSAPASCGVPFSVIEAIVIAVKQSGKLRLADLAEFNPKFDQDGHGARCAARLVYRLLAA